MTSPARWSPLLLALLSSGCGGDPHVTEFTATPAALPHGGGKVTFLWNVEGAERVSINPMIGATEAAGEATVTVSRTTTFELIASRRGARTAEQSVTVVVEPRSIAGTVVDNRSRPIEGATIRGGKETALTDGEGRFSTSIEETPFAITVSHPDATEVVRVSELSEDSVKVRLGMRRASEAVTGSAEISGIITSAAGGPMLPSNTFLLLVGRSYERWLPGPAPGNPYQLTAQWTETGSPTVDLFAVQGSTGLVGLTSILTIARAPAIELLDGDMRTIDLELQGVTTRDRSLSADVPGMSARYLYRALRFSPTSTLPLEPLVVSGDLTVPVAEIAGADMWVTLVFESADESREALATFLRSATAQWPDPLPLGEAPAPVQLLNPAPDSELSRDSPLRWSKGGHTTCAVSVNPLTSDGSGIGATFITPETAIALSDLREAGVSPIEATWLSWSLRCFDGLTPAEVAAGPEAPSDGAVIWQHRAPPIRVWVR